MNYHGQVALCVAPSKFFPMSSDWSNTSLSSSEQALPGLPDDTSLRSFTSVVVTVRELNVFLPIFYKCTPSVDLVSFFVVFPESFSAILFSSYPVITDLKKRVHSAVMGTLHFIETCSASGRSSVFT